MTQLQDDIGALESSVAKSASDIVSHALDIAGIKSALASQASSIVSLQAAVVKLQQMPAPAPTPTPASDMAALASSLGYSASRLKWNEAFAGSVLDASKWIPQIADQNGIWRKSVPAPLSAMNAGGNDAEYFDPSQVVVKDGLSLIAVPSTAQAGYSWKSGAVCTHGKILMPSGLVLVKMQQPDCRSGMWPAIWMLEGGGEIDIQEGGFLGSAPSPNNLAVGTWHPPSGSAVGKQMDAGADLSAGYHVWGLDYQPGKSMTWTLDGKVIQQITSGVPSGAFTIVLTLQVGSAGASGWRTAVGAGTPNPSVMRVAGVQWYQ